MTGGFGNSDVFNDAWRSVDGGVRWTQLSISGEWTSRYGHTSVVIHVRAHKRMPEGDVRMVLLNYYSLKFACFNYSQALEHKHTHEPLLISHRTVGS